MIEMRVQKYLSRAGLCSRRTAEGWMLEGRVKINNEICRELGTKIDPERDRIEVDGRLINLPETHVYILLNKPQGYITSMHDPEGRPIITDLLPKNMPRVWPVGRLDWNSEGLILLTNDGKLTHLLTHPTHHVPKHYAVKIQGRLESDDPKLKQLMEGVDIEDEEPTRPAFVQLMKVDRNSWLEVIIAEGRNRQIRRMFEAIGHPVMKLRRIGIGPLSIEGLRSGTFRSLHSEEVVSLYEALDALIPKEAQPSARQLKREQIELEQGRPNVRAVKPPRGSNNRSKPRPPRGPRANSEGAPQGASKPQDRDRREPAQGGYQRPGSRPAPRSNDQRPSARPGAKPQGAKPQGKPGAGAKPQGRPQGRPQGKPQGKPGAPSQGKPQGRGGSSPRPSAPKGAPKSGRGGGKKK